MNNSPGNNKPNRRRLSDLGPPPARRNNAPPSQPLRPPIPATAETLSTPQSFSQRHRVDTSISEVRVPYVANLNRTDYQRGLADLLFQSPSTWSARETIQQQIGSKILSSSKSMETRNFQRVAKQDLEKMAEAYDELFFNSLCLPLARSYGLSFRLSSRMTRAGGKTTRTIYRGTRAEPGKTHYEIALSTSLLFQSFRKPNDMIRVCGYDCRDRLTAMQRIVEHEMIHLCEMLAWIHSDCSASRFQSIARNMFGHTEHRHELITQQERAAKEFNIRAGSHVAFRFEGQTLHGVVNRITRRATILVEDERGERYNNGKRYLKYYVPIQQLRPLA